MIYVQALTFIFFLLFAWFLWKKLSVRKSISSSEWLQGMRQLGLGVNSEKFPPIKQLKVFCQGLEVKKVSTQGDQK